VLEQRAAERSGPDASPGVLAESAIRRFAVNRRLCNLTSPHTKGPTLGFSECQPPPLTTRTGSINREEIKAGWGPCIFVSFSSHQRYCLPTLQLTMHSLVMRAAVNPEPLTQVLAMRSRQVTTPWALTAATKATVRRYSTPNPNGAKLYTAGIRRRDSKQPRRKALPSALAGLLSVTVELHPPQHVSVGIFGLPASFRPITELLQWACLRKLRSIVLDLHRGAPCVLAYGSAHCRRQISLGKHDLPVSHLPGHPVQGKGRRGTNS
jgi:hypothetical protein